MTQTASAPLRLSDAAALANRIKQSIGSVIEGKPEQIHMAVLVLLAQGHLLLEDVPGVGKTVLAKALGRSIAGEVSRIQFTPDLLPSDVTGVSVFNQETREFEFKPGGIFANVVLGDEINRASPKTQSALLEVMEEAMVTVDGVRYSAGRPFMVIATQNPVEQAGTYKLPEAQLDRFLMKTSVGYPGRDAARKVLAESAQPDRSKNLSPVISQQAIAEMCDLVRDNYVDDAILDYVQDLAEATRNDPDTSMGVSTRGAIAMVRAARVWAAAHGRNFVIPDDVKELVAPVWTHRIIMSPTATFGGSSAQKVVARVLSTVPSPANQAG
mgnify:CR=1 FL=1